MAENIKKFPVFNGIAITQNTTTSLTNPPYLSLDQNNTGGYFSVIVSTVGAGTVTLGYLVSKTGVAGTWVKPSTAAALTTPLTLITGLTATGGPDSDGNFAFQIENINTTDYIGFYATEENVGAVTSLTFDIVFQ